MNRRSGQVTTEYILLAAFLVTILMGISGVLNSYMAAAGAEIESKASEVMAQRTMGIPLGWFLAQTGGGSPDSGVTAGSTSGDNAGNDSKRPLAAGETTAPTTSDSGEDDSGGDGVNAGEVPASPPSTGTATSSASGGGKSSDTASAAESDSATGRSRGARGGGGVVEVDGGDSGDSSSAQQRANDKADDGEGKKDGAGSGIGASRRAYALTTDEDRRKGSCEDFDMFRMLKILAVGALIVLGGAYLMSASGNRGGHKK